jgi:DNA mismatch repair ATPase MutS
MNIDKNETSFSFPYKIKKGISKQCIALELLENKGFDDELIKEAKEIRDKLLV